MRKTALLSSKLLALSMFVVSLLVIHPPIVCAQQPSLQAEAKDVWAPLRGLVGKWKGKGQGPTGESAQELEWKFIFGEKYLRCTTLSVAKGDHHQDVGYFSFDQARQKFVYRAFHSEGFVNRYVAEFSDDMKTITLVSEAIENGPPSMKAKVTIRLDNDQLETSLSLGVGNSPLSECASGVLARVKPTGQKNAPNDP